MSTHVGVCITSRKQGESHWQQSVPLGVIKPLPQICAPLTKFNSLTHLPNFDFKAWCKNSIKHLWNDSLPGTWAICPWERHEMDRKAFWRHRLPMGESPHPSKASDDLDWAPATCRVIVWVLQDKNDSSTACREILAPFLYSPFSPALASSIN